MTINEQSAKATVLPFTNTVLATGRPTHTCRFTGPPHMIALNKVWVWDLVMPQFQGQIKSIRSASTLVLFLEEKKSPV